MASSRGLSKVTSSKAKSPSSKQKPVSKPVATPGIPVPSLSKKWVIVQLSPMGEREKNLEMLKRAANKLLGRPVDVFVPAISQKVREESQTLFYMDGYVFVEFFDGIAYNRLQDTQYFNCVLTQSSSSGDRRKIYSLLDDRELAPMRKGMQELKIVPFEDRQKVRIIQGNYKNLIAEVSFVHEGGETVQVYVNMRSKKVLMDFPASYLQKTD